MDDRFYVIVAGKAERRGITTGDLIEVGNTRGAVRAWARSRATPASS